MPNRPKQGISFMPDGHFADDGVMKAAPVVHRMPVAITRFTFHVGHYTLTLLYSDGRVKRVTFYLDPGAWKTDCP